MPFTQGEPAGAAMCIQKGSVKPTVVNGREAVIAVLNSGDFFGEGRVVGQTVRIGSVTASEATSLLVIEKAEMNLVLHTEHEFSDRFIAYMLTRNIRVNADLVDQLFNSTETRRRRDRRRGLGLGRIDHASSFPKLSENCI
jgi:CRP/FNR family transcriptional regulator, cyclic AMP receptor protein